MTHKCGVNSGLKINLNSKLTCKTYLFHRNSPDRMRHIFLSRSFIWYSWVFQL